DARVADGEAVFDAEGRTERRHSRRQPPRPGGCAASGPTSHALSDMTVSAAVPECRVRQRSRMSPDVAGEAPVLTGRQVQSRYCGGPVASLTLAARRVPVSSV